MQVHRDGNVNFGDACLNIWEEGISIARQDGGPRGVLEWENTFKRQVFKRIVQQLKRMGWTCKVPEEMIERYGLSFARPHRYCRHGDIEAELSVSGRCIKFEMYQNVQNGENRNGGRYDFDKEKRMTYQQRLRMEYTRRKLRDYLCSVFTGYKFDNSHDKPVGPGSVTAMQWLEARIHKTGHYREDIGHASINMKCNETARDGGIIKHGQMVWYRDWRTSRIFKGQAFYDLNQSWFVVSGKYGHAIVQTYDMYTSQPPNLRQRMTSDKRRKRLESLMQQAVKNMDFEQAAKLRDILFPNDEALFMIYSDRDEMYFRQDYSGYTRDTTEAGKYTRAELKPDLGTADEKDHLRAIPVRSAA